MRHTPDQALQALALGALTTAESLRVQRHIFKCPDCLNRLIEVELRLAIADADMPLLHRKPQLKKPLFVRHDTADGFIYSRVEKRRGKWLAHALG